MTQELSAINPFNGMFGQQGWICPKCGRVFSPFTPMCLYCNNGASTSASSSIEKFIDENHDTSFEKSFENMGEAYREYLKKEGYPYDKRNCDINEVGQVPHDK